MTIARIAYWRWLRVPPAVDGAWPPDGGGRLAPPPPLLGGGGGGGAAAGGGLGGRNVFGGALGPGGLT